MKLPLTLAAAPAQVDVHNNLGDLWRAQGAAGRVSAQRCYAEALRRNPGHSPAWRGLGDLYREFGDHPQAVACYQVPACVCGLSGVMLLTAGHLCICNNTSLMLAVWQCSETECPS